MLVDKIKSPNAYKEKLLKNSLPDSDCDNRGTDNARQEERVWMQALKVRILFLLELETGFQCYEFTS